MNSTDPRVIRAQEQTAAIETGRMLAKAVIKKTDGSATVVAVYETATYNKFYFIYELRRARSPRRLWHQVWTYGIYQGKVFSLADMVTRITLGRKYEGCKISFRYFYGKRRFDAFVSRVANPNLEAPVRPASDWYLVAKMNAKFHRKVKGRFPA